MIVNKHWFMESGIVPFVVMAIGKMTSNVTPKFRKLIRWPSRSTWVIIITFC